MNNDSPPSGIWAALLVLTGVGALTVLSAGMFGHFRLLREKEQWQGEVAQRETVLQNLQAQIQKHATEEATARTQSEGAKANAARIHEQYTRFKSEVDKLESRLQSLQAVYDSIDAERLIAIQSRNEAAQQHSQLTNEISILTAQIATLKPQERQLQETVSGLQRQKQTLDAENVAEQKRQEALRQTLDQLTTELSTKRTDLKK